MKRKLVKSMCLAMLLVAFAGYGTEKNAVLPQMDLPKAEAAAKAAPAPAPAPARRPPSRR